MITHLPTLPPLPVQVVGLHHETDPNGAVYVEYPDRIRWRGPKMGALLAPAYKAYGRDEVNKEMDKVAEALTHLTGVEIVFHNIIDSDCNAPEYGEAFFKAQKAK